jgi:hypothetical protein
MQLPKLMFVGFPIYSVRRCLHCCLLLAALVLPVQAQVSTITAANQPVEADSPPSQRLTYEEYVTYTEQAIQSLSARLEHANVQLNILRSQAQGVQDALTDPSRDAAEKAGSKFLQTEKDLLGKYQGCSGIDFTGKLTCEPAEPQ